MGILQMDNIEYNEFEENKIKVLPLCPVEMTISLIGDKWKVIILRDLFDGTKRYNELKRSLGKISQKVLTTQLRALERDGIISRKVYAEVPPKVEYSLTPMGLTLKPVLDAMADWGTQYKKLGKNKDSEV